MSRQTDLGEFGDELSDVKADTQLEWAAVESAEVMRRENAFEVVDPLASGSKDEGVQIEFHLASGRTFETWFTKPTEWDVITNNLVLLLEYWELDPGDIEQLNSDEEVYEVPVDHNKAIGQFRPDWQEIERTVQTREKARELDDGN